jgi:hypothetical protein
VFANEHAMHSIVGGSIGGKLVNMATAVRRVALTFNVVEVYSNRDYPKVGHNPPALPTKR